MADKTRVAQYQADRTNQKLYFCRLACQAATKTSSKQLYQAECETAIFHLQGAFLAFLQELNQYYGLNLEQPTLKSIKDKLHERTQISPEVQRLQLLLENGFLADVMRAFERCQYAPKLNAAKLSEASVHQDGLQPQHSAKQNSANRSTDLIVNVVTLSSQWLPDDSTIREWRGQFVDLIDQLRAGMAEY